MKIDLNFPDFQKDLFRLEKNELYALIKTFRTLSRMDFNQLRRSSGLNLEHLKSTKTRKGNPIYSIRITRAFRAVLSIESDYLRFISLRRLGLLRGKARCTIKDDFQMSDKELLRS